MTCHIQSVVLAIGWFVVIVAATLTFVFAHGRGQRFGCIASAIAAIVVFVWMSQTAPAISTAIPRAWQRETVHRMQRIAAAMNAAEVARRRPASIRELASITHAQLQERDAWGNPFYFRAEPSRYVVISYGQCGNPDRPDPWTYSRAETMLFTDDTVLINGSFVRTPLGILPE